MLPVIYQDVEAAACALLAHRGDRARFLARILRAADAADAHRRRTGRRDPLWGDGTLKAAAWAWPRVPRPPMADAEFLECMALVCSALAERADAQGAPAPCAAPRQPGAQPAMQSRHSAMAGSAASRAGSSGSPQDAQSP